MYRAASKPFFCRAFVRFFLFGFAVVAGLAGAARADNADDDDLVIKPPPASAVDPRAVEVRFNDDSRLKLALADDHLEIDTRYGRLKVAVEDLRRIQFAQRQSPAKQKLIDEALAQLAGSEGDARALAAGRLVAMGSLAYPAIGKAAANKDTAIGKRAAQLLETLKETVDEAEFAPRDLDIVQTVDSTISGHIVVQSLKIRAEQFGELNLKLADAHSLRSQSLIEVAAIDTGDSRVLPDPGTLSGRAEKVGRTLRFRVTGAQDAIIWGTDVYTADSQLATAAVHAGVLQVGQSAIVKVKLVPPPPSFTGSQSNGVDSNDFGPFSQAYKFVK